MLILVHVELRTECLKALGQTAKPFGHGLLFTGLHHDHQNIAISSIFMTVSMLWGMFMSMFMLWIM